MKYHFFFISKHILIYNYIYIWQYIYLNTDIYIYMYLNDCNLLRSARLTVNCMVDAFKS